MQRLSILRACAPTLNVAGFAGSLDAVPYVTMCNLSSLNAAMRGGLMELIEVHLKCVVLHSIFCVHRRSC